MLITTTWPHGARTLFLGLRTGTHKTALFSSHKDLISLGRHGAVKCAESEDHKETGSARP